jgi:hypothetical protein
MANDPSSETLSWDNVPNLFYIPAGSTEAVKFPESHYTPEIIAAWISEYTSNKAIQALDASLAGLVDLVEQTKDGRVSEIFTNALNELHQDDFDEFDDDDSHQHYPGEGEL